MSNIKLKMRDQWVVDIDLERFFDRVNHDLLMARVARRVADKRLLQLIRAFLTAGVMEDGLVSPADEGAPQGGPLSPLLSNLVLDDLDRELGRRGHRFCRYADDCNIYVRSRRAGERVMAGVGKFLTKKLRLKVNESKSAVARPDERMIGSLKPYLLGWRSYFGFSQDFATWMRGSAGDSAWGSGGSGGRGRLDTSTYGDWECPTCERQWPLAPRLACGRCRDTRLSSKRCPMPISTRSACLAYQPLRTLNSSEPSWYGTRMPGGVTGKAREGLPMSISGRQSHRGKSQSPAA